MRPLRMALLSLLVAVPLAWSAQMGLKTRAEALNEVLSTLLIGVLPLLAAMLLWTESFSAADADVRYGRDRRGVALRNFGALTAALTLMSLLYGLGSVIWLRGPSDALLLKDLLATAALCIPGALALGTFLGAGRLFLGKIGLSVLLVLVWALGPVDALVSALVPTGHIRYLVGAGSELPFPGWVSLVALWVMSALFGTAMYFRVPR